MPGYRLDLLTTVRLTAQKSSVTIGSGTNGTITIVKNAAGAQGNLNRVAVVAGVGNNHALAVSVDVGAIQITLATDGSGNPDDAANTAALIVAAIISASAAFTPTASGDGSSPISAAIPITLFAGGRDVFQVSDVARESNTSDTLVKQLEGGGICSLHEAEQMAAALGSTTSLLGMALVL